MADAIDFVYLYRRTMKKNKIMQAGAVAGAAPQIQISPICRILVVADDPYICHFNAEALVRHGYEVNAVEDGATAWEELQANRYHLLIADQRIPKVSGVGLFQKIHAARMALPVILATKTLPRREFSQLPWLQPPN